MPTTLSASALNDLSAKVLGAAVAIHRVVGPGLLERAYLACLEHELRSTSLHVEAQVPIPFIYNGKTIDCAYRADLIVEHALLVEVKAIEAIALLHRQQLYTYLRLGDYRLGLLLNFGAATMKDGITRVVNRFPDR
jgi:GxxExxY protein